MTHSELTPAPEDVGREWLWWDVERETWRRVEILEVPAERAQRVRVQHLDPDMRGRAEWSPIGRCRVPWDQKDAYIDDQIRQKRATSHRFDRDSRDAAIRVFLTLVPEAIAFIGYLPHGTMEVDDIETLSTISGVSVDEILAHPDTYADGDRWWVPWPVAEMVASQVAARNARRILDVVRAEERNASAETEQYIDGLITRGRRSQAGSVTTTGIR